MIGRQGGAEFWKRIVCDSAECEVSQELPLITALVDTIAPCVVHLTADPEPLIPIEPLMPT